MLHRKATLTSKGQVTIPKGIRDFLKLSPGDRIDFVIGSHGEVLIAPKTRDIHTLKWLLHKPGQRSVSVEEMNQAIRNRAKRNVKS